MLYKTEYMSQVWQNISDKSNQIWYLWYYVQCVWVFLSLQCT